MPITVATRQVHLDFHTSEHIRNVGGEFSEANFKKALQLGNIDSITVFAKCHHSWSYYPTKVGQKHPHLKTDLLGRMIAAAHDVGVRAPIYYTVGWSANDAAAHPDWVVENLDRSLAGERFDVSAKPGSPRPDCSWLYLDPTGGYLDLMARQVEELCTRYPVDGFFFDICHGPVSLSPRRLKALRAAGLDPQVENDRQEFRVNTWRAFATRMRQIILSRHADATVFFNGLAGIETDHRHFENQTHFELEDLPTTWGGYDKLAPRARYFHRFRKPMLAMSGKFHTYWGEFGGFKHRDAIRQEAASMVAFGAGCSFGDQLHPEGAMDLQTYRNIGFAYDLVKRLSPYTTGAQPASDLAILHTDGDQTSGSHGRTLRQFQGVANMLLELQHDFRVLTPGDDLSGIRTLILPGPAFLSPKISDQLHAFVKSGGSILALGDSVLDQSRKRVLLNAGVRYLGPAKFLIDYSVVHDPVAYDLPKSPYLNYEAAGRFIPTTATQLAALHEPYFDRTYAKYCSHQNTPYSPKVARHGGAFLQGRIAFIPTPLGGCYHDVGARVHRQLFANVLKCVYPNPIVEADLPSGARISLVHQPLLNRYILHLLYAPPMPRGRCQILEDAPEFRDVSIRVRLPEKVVKVTAESRVLKFTTSGATQSTSVILPRLKWNIAICFDVRSRTTTK